MKHFYYYPTVEYGTETLVNIMLRGKIRDAVLEKTALYYQYSIKDGQRPDIVADKYYGNPKLAWAIFYANNMFHPVYDWPMDYSVFSKYLESKYGVSYPRGSLGAIHHYELYNKNTGQVLIVDKDMYLRYGSPTKVAVAVDVAKSAYEITDSSTNETYLMDAETHRTYYADTSMIGRSVSVYQYEVELNEKKRNIFVLDKAYITQLTNELITLFK